MASFRHAGQRIAFSEVGAGPRVVVLVHGLLLSQRMHAPLAQALAARGNRVVTIDLLGHGRSARPLEPASYSTASFAEQVVALLDHLSVDEAVVLGTSLGANVALEVAALAPHRLGGIVVEMPVLDHALVACLVAFGPLLVGLELGLPLARLASRAARAVPSAALPFWADVALDTVRRDPEASAAVLKGLLSGRAAPPAAERRRMRTPALVLGHRRDPIHPLSDAGALADELPGARLVEADSILELRLRPARLTDEIAAFLDECHARPRRRAARPRRPAAPAADAG